MRCYILVQIALLERNRVHSQDDPLAGLQLCPVVALGQLNARKAVRIDLAPDAELRARIAQALDIRGLRKFTFAGELRPVGRRDWELRAHLGATIVQDCAITLAPVTTRIDEQVLRRYLADMPEVSALEMEMPEDDTTEPLGRSIDPGAVALEALLLALPAFPRADGAELTPEGVLRAAPDGAADAKDDRPRPFAVLARLKDAAQTGSSDGDD